jgi:hypothetical protein
MMFHDNQFFCFEEIEKYKSLGLTVDGTKGGLLLGNSHENGGIQMLFKYSDGYRLRGEVEGKEYLVNSEASKLFASELRYISNIKRDEPIFMNREVDLTNITIIDCRVNNVTFSSKFLLVDEHDSWHIINMYSTIGHLHRLENINRNYIKLFEKEKFDRETFEWFSNRKSEQKIQPKKVNIITRLFGRK